MSKAPAKPIRPRPPRNAGISEYTTYLRALETYSTDLERYTARLEQRVAEQKRLAL